MSNEVGRGSLIIVSAPSGAGKTTLCRRVIAELGGTIRYSISHTTRPRRGQERDAVDYHFVSDARFDEMIAGGELAEWATIHRRRYGTSKAEIATASSEGIDLFLDIEGQGAAQIKRQYPEALGVFILPPSLDVLRERLLPRGTDDPAEIARRLENARREADYIDNYDYIIVNDDLDAAVRALTAVVSAAKQRREMMGHAIRRFTTA